jgi:hypothetical protein
MRHVRWFLSRGTTDQAVSLKLLTRPYSGADSSVTFNHRGVNSINAVSNREMWDSARSDSEFDGRQLLRNFTPTQGVADGEFAITNGYDRDLR